MGRIGGKRKVLINDQRTCGEKKLLLNGEKVLQGDHGVGDDVPKGYLGAVKSELKGDLGVADDVQKGDLGVADEELKGDQGNQKGTNGSFRPKKYTECTDEELFRMTYAFRHNKITLDKGLKEMPKLRQYLIQLSESGGFDVTGPIPKIEWMQGYVRPLTITTKKMQKFVKDLDQMAIQSYNEDHPKDNYEVLQVEKVTMETNPCDIYYITFTAKDYSPNKRYRSPKTFQAEVAICPRTAPDGVVEFCRLKPKNYEDCESP